MSKKKKKNADKNRLERSLKGLYGSGTYVADSFYDDLMNVEIQKNDSEQESRENDLDLLDDVRTLIARHLERLGKDAVDEEIASDITNAVAAVFENLKESTEAEGDTNG